MVCDKEGVWKMVVDKDCVWKMVLTKMVCERWCWQRCVIDAEEAEAAEEEAAGYRIKNKNPTQRRGEGVIFKNNNNDNIICVYIYI